MNPAPGITVDLLIIGGGINGTGIARDAAGRGLSVLLVEQDDLAAHTSSASTKLIHGGLRYLEYYEFHLVREALIERERLLSIAPHLIWPLEFVIPHAKGQRPAWMIRLGLFLYDHLAPRKKLPASHAVTFSPHPAAAVLYPRYQRGFTYADCHVEDSRLVILNAADAAARGATLLTRTRLCTARPEGPLWQAEIEDTLTGTSQTITARAIVNAAGPWVVDVLTTKLHRPTAEALRLVKGSHIITNRLYDGDFAFTLQNPDGRIVFVLPYEQNFTLIGTTDIPYKGDPAAVSISPAETRYLCDTVTRYFRRPVKPTDVVRSYSGVRPLYDDHAKNASAVTRDYVLHVEGSPTQPALLSVFGGKITTYRKLAEHALEKLLPAMGRDIGKPWTATTPLPGGGIPDFAAYLQTLEEKYKDLPKPLLHRLARAYGTNAEQILAQPPGEDFGASLTEAEVNYLITQEWARTAEDILWRRSKLALHVPPDTPARLAAYLAAL